MHDVTARKKPTDSELSILQVLWRLGEGTVRDVHEELTKTREMGYTTVLKLMQLMAEKGLVTRVESGRAHIYRSSESQDASQQKLVGDFIDKAFGGSATSLVMHALSAKNTSHEELEAIRRLLDELEDTHG